MKRIKYLILIVCMMFIPVLNINAEEVEKIEKFHVVAGDSVTSSSKVNGSSIVAGNNVTSENSVDGIDMVFGNAIDYTSNSDYSLVAGNIVNVKGVTKNDSFIFGNSIVFDENYQGSRDLFVFASTVTLKGEIKRDVTIYASVVVLENLNVNGNVTIYADSIEIKNTTILSKLKYNENATITKDSSNINQTETYQGQEVETADIVTSNIINYASVLLVFVAMYLIIPTMFNKIEKMTDELSLAKIISMIGYGMFYLIIIPIIFVMLLLFTIGLPLALLILGIYITVMLLSTIFTGYFIGIIIWKKFIKKEINHLLAGLLGITIIKFLSLVPMIGVITTLITMLLSLSIFIKLFKKNA